MNGVLQLNSFEKIKPADSRKNAFVHPDLLLYHLYDVVLRDPSSGELGRVARLLQYRRYVIFVNLRSTTSAGTGTDAVKTTNTEGVSTQVMRRFFTGDMGSSSIKTNENASTSQATVSSCCISII